MGLLGGGEASLKVSEIQRQLANNEAVLLIWGKPKEIKLATTILDASEKFKATTPSQKAVFKLWSYTMQWQRPEVVQGIMMGQAKLHLAKMEAIIAEAKAQDPW